MAAAAIAAVALALALVWVLRPEDEPRPDAADAVVLAERHVQALVSLTAEHVDAELAVLQQQATGDWAEQLKANPEAMARELRSGRVNARGRVDSSAVVPQEGDDPRILVAASAIVSNKAGPRPRTQTYYFVVTTTRVGAGWRVAGVEVAQ